MNDSKDEEHEEDEGVPIFAVDGASIEYKIGSVLLLFYQDKVFASYDENKVEKLEIKRRTIIGISSPIDVAKPLVKDIEDGISIRENFSRRET